MPTFQITIQRGPDPGQIVILDKQTVIIGRDATTDITLNDPEVSRNHCRLILQGTYLIQDLGSTNGTFVDGRRLKGEPVRLRHGQHIQLGSNVIMVYEEVEGLDVLGTAGEQTAVRAAGEDELEDILEESEPVLVDSPVELEPEPAEEIWPVAGERDGTPVPEPAGRDDRRRTYLIVGGVLILLICCAVFGIWLGYFLTMSGLLPAP